MFGCVCYFIVECYGLVKSGWRFSIVWSSKKYVCYACDPSARLDVPSIYLVCVFVCRKMLSAGKLCPVSFLVVGGCPSVLL